MDGVQNDRQARIHAQNLFPNLQPVQPGHREVHHHQIRSEVNRVRHRLKAICSLSADLPPWMGLDQPSQKPAERRVIVCQKDSRQHGTYEFAFILPGCLVPSKYREHLTRLSKIALLNRLSRPLFVIVKDHYSFLGILS
jgi:hypothetical protein